MRCNQNLSPDNPFCREPIGIVRQLLARSYTPVRQAAGIVSSKLFTPVRISEFGRRNSSGTYQPSNRLNLSHRGAAPGP